MGNPYGMSDQMLWDAVEERGMLRIESDKQKERIRSLEEANRRGMDDNIALRAERDLARVQLKDAEAKLVILTAGTKNIVTIQYDKIPAGFFLAPLEPDEDMWSAGREPVMYRDMNHYRPKDMEIPAWQKHPDGTVEVDTSKGTTAMHVWRAMRNWWLQYHPEYASKES